MRNRFKVILYQGGNAGEFTALTEAFRNMIKEEKPIDIKIPTLPNVNIKLLEVQSTFDEAAIQFIIMGIGVIEYEE